MDNIRYFYLRAPSASGVKGCPTGLVAFARHGKDEVRFAASFLNPKDVWCRETARGMATGRLIAGRKNSCITLPMKDLSKVTLRYLALYFGSTFEAGLDQENRFEVAKSWLLTKEEALKNPTMTPAGKSSTTPTATREGSGKKSNSHFFLRDEKGRPSAVVALEDRGDTVAISASFCSPHDVWNRDLGVKIAYGRLEKPSSTILLKKGGYVPSLADVAEFYGASLGASLTYLEEDKFSHEVSRLMGRVFGATPKARLDEVQRRLDLLRERAGSQEAFEKALEKIIDLATREVNEKLAQMSFDPMARGCSVHEYPDGGFVVFGTPSVDLSIK